MSNLDLATSGLNSQRLSSAQSEILASGLLTSGFSCVLQMPTGSGKTWLAEQAIAHVLGQNRRVIYLTPLKALADELMQRWQTQFAPKSVGIFTGDYANGNYPIPFQAAQLLVMTPEKLDACTRNWRSYWSWIPEIDLVIVDELHLLGDSGRGARLEGTLLRIMRLNPFVRVLGLSATLGNRHELADWLQGVEYVSHLRPVPLEWQVVRYKKAQDKFDLLLQVVKPILAAAGKSLVFVQSRRRAELLAEQLRELGFQAEHHHAGVERGQRQTIEARFRSGQIDILVATATLEMGLNLPARQVVLYDLQGFDGVEFVPLPVNNIWQRAGRAGRPGLDSVGEVVLLAPIWAPNPEYYVQGRFERILSGLRHHHALSEQVIAEVACGLCRTAGQLKSVFSRSLASLQGQLPDIHEVVGDMLSAGMLMEKTVDEDTILQATKLGFISTRHMVSPRSVLLFKRVLEKFPELTFLDLLMLAVASDDCSSLIPVDFEQLAELAEKLEQEASVLMGLSHQDLSETLACDGKSLLAVVHTALIVRAWTRVGVIETVAKDWGCYITEVGSLREILQRLLLVMAQISQDVNLPVPPECDRVGLAERINVLGKMVDTGLDEGTVTLTLVPGIGPTYARRLREIGLADIEDLALAETAEIAAIPGVSNKRVAHWIIQAADLGNGRLSAYRYRETVSHNHIVNSEFPSEIDPYRLRRALELSIVGQEGVNYRVIGGTDPHTVRANAGNVVCDCLDFSKGNICKHILAVRFHRKEPEIRRIAQTLTQKLSGHEIDLLHLWMGK